MIALRWPDGTTRALKIGEYNECDEYLTIGPSGIAEVRLAMSSPTQLPRGPRVTLILGTREIECTCEVLGSFAGEADGMWLVILRLKALVGAITMG